MRTLVCLALVALTALACGGGGGSSNATGAEVGAFFMLQSNIEQNSIWPLNKAMSFDFNHAIDPDSVSFASVIVRPLDPLLPPVTGRFELDASDAKRLWFRPSCPTNESFDNGGLQPGGVGYEVAMPIGGFGAAILRDRAGRTLSRSFSRRFRTPVPPHEPLFLDTRVGAPQLLEVVFPTGLNFFTDESEAIRLRFDQAIDPRSANLNRDRILVLYSKDTIASGKPLEFPDDHRLPGEWLVLENCGETGAELIFQLRGLLPPDREIRLVVKQGFSDLSGERTIGDQAWLPHPVTPTLSDWYRDPSWIEDETTFDEFQESFDTAGDLDLSIAQALPLATIEPGYVQAAFDFPGQFVPPEGSFELRNLIYQEINTDEEVLVTDSNNRSFLVRRGVLNVHDLRIEAGSTLRGRGGNPLIIYASGEVVIDGRLDVSGNHSRRVSAINAPQFPEGGAAGECGGGDGGTGSWRTDQETRRAESGDGPFGLIHAGGQGGESSLNQGNNGGFDFRHIVAAGGGGGTFGMTPNVAIHWHRWKSGAETGFGIDTTAPDLQNLGGFYPPEAIVGGEAGVRGSSYHSWQTDPNRPHGAYGMEDLSPDTEADETAGFNPPGDQFLPGIPVRGPDGGLPGPTIFRNDGWTGNDFWGRRRNTDGSVTVGELLVPWAGSGGGAGGDSQILNRFDLDFDGTLDPLLDFFPRWIYPYPAYYKGTAGGGGGGQLLLFAIGSIRLGPESVIQSNGGIGHSGGPMNFLDLQISGSGGGSGGHVVVHTARKLDLSAIDVGTATKASQVPDLTAQDNLRAVGGRRGWCGRRYDPAGRGNGDLMIGRGGAGGNGVIQVHVSDPARDILWPEDADKGIRDYLFDGDPLNPLDMDRLEEVLALFSAPQSYALVPFFGARSRVHSRWIDTGMAGIRQPAQGSGPWPDWDAAELAFQGITRTGLAAGLVEVERGIVKALAPIASGPDTVANFRAFEVVIDSAASYFDPVWLRNPVLLQGYEILPDVANTSAFRIVSANYDRSQDRLVCQTAVIDGPMTLATQPGQPWSLRSKFFGVSTDGVRDALPETASLRIEFQAAAESAPGSAKVGAPVPGPGQWTADLSTLQGLRFLRYRLSFDIDAAGVGADLSSPRPRIEYLKLPFAW